MRPLFLLIGLFILHRVLMRVYPPYRQRFQEFDRKVAWISLILVLYVVGNFIYLVFFR
jgi:hypothetical protein